MIELNGEGGLRPESLAPTGLGPAQAVPLSSLGPMGLPKDFPSPVSFDPEAVAFWFRLIETLDDPRQKDGLTARQAVRKLSLEHQEALMANLLEALADRRDLVRKSGNPPRYRPQALARSLPAHIREATQRSAPPWERFDLAVLAYSDQPRALEWSALKDAFRALVDSLGWPEAVVREAKLNAERWVGPAGNVTPPSFLAKEDDYAAMRAEIDRLTAENERLKAAMKQRPAEGDLGGKKADLRARADRFERENTALRQEVESLRADLDGFLESAQQPENRRFLEGSGHGPLPASLSEAEVNRLRKLVTGTKAASEIQLALVRALGELYATPTAFTRLTSNAFKEHDFDTLWRVRVMHYRIVYGLKDGVPQVLELEARGKVYGSVVKKL